MGLWGGVWKCHLCPAGRFPPITTLSGWRKVMLVVFSPPCPRHAEIPYIICTKTRENTDDAGGGGVKPNGVKGGQANPHPGPHGESPPPVLALERVFPAASPARPSPPPVGAAARASWVQAAGPRAVPDVRTDVLRRGAGGRRQGVPPPPCPPPLPLLADPGNRSLCSPASVGGGDWCAGPSNLHRHCLCRSCVGCQPESKTTTKLLSRRGGNDCHTQTLTLTRPQQQEGTGRGGH